MPALSSAQLAHIQTAVYNKVDTKGKQFRLNSKRRPFLAWLMKLMEPTSLEGGSLTYKQQVESGLVETTWVGDDQIDASEPDILIDLTYGYFNFNIAIRILHDELRRLGYTILPNGTGQLDERAFSKSEQLKLVKYLTKLVVEQRDAYDRRLDLLLHRSGAQSNTVQPGIFGLLSLTPTVGNIGTKSRAAFPVLQNQVATGLTITAAGTLRSGLDRLWRQANIFGVDGGVPGELQVVFAGQAFIEGIKAWREANNWQVRTDPGTLAKLDIAIPDSSIEYDGMPVVHNPTMDTLDSIDVSSPTFTKQSLWLNPKTIQFRNQEGLHKVASAPMDPPNQRLTRQDLDGTYSLGINAPASNGIAALA